MTVPATRLAPLSLFARLPPGHGAADVHLHTTYSDGSAAPLDVLKKAIEIGLNVIAITDHDRIDGAVVAAEAAAGSGCEVIVGEEISSAGGHIAGLFLKSAVSSGLSVAATIAAIHEQGGLAVAVHPFYRLGGARGVGPAAAGLAWDAIEVENASPVALFANRRARAAQASWARAATGGSDAHVLAAVGAAVTTFPGRGAADLRHALETGNTTAVQGNRSPAVAMKALAWSVQRRITIGRAARTGGIGVSPPDLRG